MNVGLLVLWLGLHFTPVFSYDSQEVIACDQDTVELECASDSFIAIHEAVFTTNASEGLPSCSATTAGEESFVNGSCTEDIRMPLNYRCSGETKCTFILVAHYATRQCQDPGTVKIIYACVETNQVHHYCNRKIVDAEGYIRSPGYPRYYPGPLRCEWTIRAPDGQRLLVQVLDLSMVEPPLDRPTYCTDHFTLLDGQVKLLQTCGERDASLRLFESATSVVTVKVFSNGIGARRGMLLWYKTVGCPTLPAPDHGYLVYRNTTFAQYMCCTNHLFEDSLERTRDLYCAEGNRWNDSLSNCLDKKTLREIKNTTSSELEDDIELEPIHKIPLSDTDVIFDIMVPSAIMGVLILGNAIIVIVLLKLRKSVKEDPENDMERVSPEKEMELKKMHISSPAVTNWMSSQPSTSSQSPTSSDRITTDV